MCQFWKKVNSSSVNNYKPNSLSNNFPTFLHLLYTITCHIISNMNWFPVSMFCQKLNLQQLIRYPTLLAFCLLLVLNVKLILFILALAVHLTLSRIIFWLHKLCTDGLSDNYVNWFRSYLSNRWSSVRARSGAVVWGTAPQTWRSRVRFHWHNPSCRSMVLELTQPLTEMSTRNISWG